MQMKRTKVVYKNAIKAHQTEDNWNCANDLHKLLLEKDMANFWTSWNSKIVKSEKLSAIINGEINRFIMEFFGYFSVRCEHRSLTKIQHVHLLSGSFCTF